MQKKKLGTIAGAAIALLVGIFGWFATTDESSNNLSSAQTEIGTTTANTVANAESTQDPEASTPQTSESQTSTGATSADPTETAPPSRSTEEPSTEETTPKSQLPLVDLDSLPVEALDTLELIQNKGPYPYRQDNGTFQNRERLLPIEHSKYYREFTVETPGSADRGARRIVTGGGGEGYYTSDHYNSFKEIEGWSWK